MVHAMNTISQSWPIPGGTVVVQVATNDPLTAEQVSALGALMAAAKAYADAQTGTRP